MFGLGKKKRDLTQEPVDLIADPSETKKGWLSFWNKNQIGFIPVNVLRKRGKGITILKTRGRLSKADKEAEVYRLQLADKRILDAVDYTRINADGSLTVVEKPDGELSYADFSNDLLTSTGDGILRDAYIQNDNWINQNFKKKEDIWSKIAPMLVLGLVLACISVSFYLTYNYLGGVVGQADKLSVESAKTQREILQVQGQISSNLIASLDRLAQISADIKTSSVNSRVTASVSTMPTTSTTTTITANSTA